MNESSIQLKFITPLWTGNIDSRTDFIQSTGIIGSLRWWMETILRGMGYYACDPVSDERCPKKVNNNLTYCLACLIFGATGKRRLFRVEINDKDVRKVFEGRPINIKPSGRNRGWFLGSGLTGKVELRIIPLDRRAEISLFLLPLLIAAKWAAIGAKTQLGYGVVELSNASGLKLEAFKKSLNKIIEGESLRSETNKDKNNSSNTELPNLREMFFAKVQFKVNSEDWWAEVDGIKEAVDQEGKMLKEKNSPILKAWYNSGSVPIAPAIKNWLRFQDGKQLWQTNHYINSHIEKWLFGTTGNNKVASKINISCAYRINDSLWEFRIWGWIPLHGHPSGFNRNSFLEKLKDALSGNGSIKIPWIKLLGAKTEDHQLVDWREYNSLRKDKTPNESNIEKFIESLL